MCARCDALEDMTEEINKLKAEHAEEMAERAERGHEFLVQDQGADYFRHVDWERFDITDIYDCIGGQLYGSYTEMYDKLPVPHDDTPTGAYYGFDTEHWTDGPALQKAWLDIRDRLSAE